MCAKCIECIYINIYIFILGIPLSVQRRHADSVLSILSIYINIHIFTCRKSSFFFLRVISQMCVKCSGRAYTCIHRVPRASLERVSSILGVCIRVYIVFPGYPLHVYSVYWDTSCVQRRNPECIGCIHTYIYIYIETILIISLNIGMVSLPRVFSVFSVNIHIYIYFIGENLDFFFEHWGGIPCTRIQSIGCKYASMHIHMERILISPLNTGVVTLARVFSVLGVSMHVCIFMWRES